MIEVKLNVNEDVMVRLTDDGKFNPRLGTEMIEWCGEQKDIVDDLSKLKKPIRGFLTGPKGGNR